MGNEKTISGLAAAVYYISKIAKIFLIVLAALYTESRHFCIIAF